MTPPGEPPTPGRRKLLEYWWVLPVGATLGVFGGLLEYARRVTLGKRRAGPVNYADGPRVRVAPLAALARPFDTAEFGYGGTACVAVRLPEATAHSLAAGGAHFVAFSRVCTHLGCLVNPVRDPEVVALSYNYRTDHPVLGCPCHFAVFDPLLEGEAVIGRAVAPLPRVRLEARGGVLYATGLEPAPTPSG